MATSAIACGGGSSGGKRSKEPTNKADKIAEAKRALKAAKEAEKDGDTKLAHDEYKTALKYRPEHFETVERYSRFLIAQNRAQDAIKVASNYLSRSAGDPSQGQAYHLVADAQMAAMDWLGAHETLTEWLELDNGDAIAMFKRGKVQIERNNFDAALEDLDKAIGIDKENADFYAAKGMLLERSDKLKSARIELNRAIKLNSRHGEAHITLGLVLRKQGETAEALAAHEKAAKFAPENAEAHFQLGLSQNYEGDNMAAEISLKKATELNDKNALYWYAYGEVLRNLDRPKEAIKPYRMALKLDPEYAKAADKLGLVLIAANELEGAETLFTERVKTYPNEPRAWFHLGQIYDKSEKFTLAIEAFEKFVTLAEEDDSDVDPVKKRLRALKRKR